MTDDIPSRVAAHNAGSGAAWTSLSRPVKLVYHEACQDMPGAVRRERQIKQWSRDKKQALIEGDISRLKGLSRRRIPQRP